MADPFDVRFPKDLLNQIAGEDILQPAISAFIKQPYRGVPALSSAFHIDLTLQNITNLLHIRPRLIKTQIRE
jgi:hypothetical protein